MSQIFIYTQEEVGGHYEGGPSHSTPMGYYLGRSGP